MIRTRLPLTSALIAFALAGCHGASEAPANNDSAATAFVPPPTKPPTPLPGLAHAVPLGAYVGHYPNEAVDGVTFFDRTEVANALIGAVGDADLRAMILSTPGVTIPIFRYRNRIGAHGCEPHNCDAHNWSFLLLPDGSGALACFHEEATMGDTSRWYDNDKPVARPGNCPQR